MTLSAKEKLSLVKKSCLNAFIYVGVFSCIINLLMLTVPLYMLQIFDRVLASHSYDTLLYLSLIAVLALLVMGLLDIARSRILVRVSRWLDNQLSPLALEKSADESLSGSPYASQSLRDINSIRQMLSGNSIFALFDSPWVPLYLFVVFLLQPTLGMIATIGAIILFLFALLNDLVTKNPLLLVNQQNAVNQRYIEKTLLNAEAIQGMGMLPCVINKWFGENEKVLHLQNIISDRANLVLSTSKFIRLVLQIFMLGYGAFLAIIGEITPGVMIAASIISARALAPIEQTIGMWKQWKGAKRAYLRLNEYLHKPDPRGNPMELPKPKGNLMANNLTYVPPGGKKPIIQGVNLQLKAGEVLVLMGHSGSGKSTLARLLLGIWRPSTGVASLDGANVYEWMRDQFGNEVGYMPQNVDLFDAPIRENISRMRDADDAAIIKAAQLAGAHELILQFPGGYDFNVGTFSLSGGQRQRIALARALFGDPCFIVLDEPNASLDSAGELALHHAVRDAKAAGKTMVIISHRPDLVQHADKIMVLQKGVVQLYGPRDDVIQAMKEKKAK